MPSNENRFYAFMADEQMYLGEYSNELFMTDDLAMEYMKNYTGIIPGITKSAFAKMMKSGDVDDVMDDFRYSVANHSDALLTISAQSHDSYGDIVECWCGISRWCGLYFALVMIEDTKIYGPVHNIPDVPRLGRYLDLGDNEKFDVSYSENAPRIIQAMAHDYFESFATKAGALTTYK